MYNQVSSVSWLYELTTTTRIIANIIIMTVIEKMPPKASFFRILIRTFQSKLIGTRMTEESYQ